jgi:hypothetical protein
LLRFVSFNFLNALTRPRASGAAGLKNSKIMDSKALMPMGARPFCSTEPITQSLSAVVQANRHDVEILNCDGVNGERAVPPLTDTALASTMTAGVLY